MPDGVCNPYTRQLEEKRLLDGLFHPSTRLMVRNFSLTTGSILKFFIHHEGTKDTKK
jgi:hypothetical protein